MNFTLNTPHNKYYDYIVKHNSPRVKHVNDLIMIYDEQCCWLISNMTHFGYTDAGWVFKRKEDAVAFMLTWGYE